MSNQYPGYCIDCGRQVKPGHGDLKKQNGKYVVSCGRGKSSAAAPAPKPAAPKVVAPEGVRLSDVRIASENASLCIRFAVNGSGLATSSDWGSDPFRAARAIKYARWSEEIRNSLSPEREQEAIRHDALCEQNEALHATLAAQGQIANDSSHEFTFPLSAEEHAMLHNFVTDAKSRLLAAILDGTAEIRVGEVGCDYPHNQILGIKVAGVDQEYALIQNVLGTFNLSVSGQGECRDLAGAIRARQEQHAKREAEKAAHKAHRAQGFHVVLLKRCWECGRTQILGELDDNMCEIRMPADVYAACQREQKEAHARSLETVPAGTILSSVGFEPMAESKFEFRIIESDWYCGC